MTEFEDFDISRWSPEGLFLYVLRPARQVTRGDVRKSINVFLLGAALSVGVVSSFTITVEASSNVPLLVSKAQLRAVSGDVPTGYWDRLHLAYDSANVVTDDNKDDLPAAF